MTFNYSKLFDSRGNLSASKISSCSDLEKEQIKNPHLRSDRLPEHIYWNIHGLTDYPVKCLTCGGSVTAFESFSKGYIKKFCSLGCMQKHPETHLKKKATIKKRYGVDSIWQVPDIIARREATCSTKFGDRNSMSMAREALHKKYNVSHVSAIPGVISSRISTILIKSAKRFSEMFSSKFEFNINEYAGHDDKMSFLCKTCKTRFSDKPSISLLCPVCDKSEGRSSNEEILISFIREIYNGEIEVNKSFRMPDGSTVYPDINIPDKKLIIEADGNYWHAEGRGGDKLKSYRKRKAYEEQGFNSLFFFEDEIVLKKDIVFAMIRSALGIYKNRIMARHCEFVEIENSIASDFCETFHLQGAGRQKYSFALKHNDEIVAVATFGTPRYNKQADCELIRLCFRAGIAVSGGSEKLLKNAMRVIGAKSLVSYSDNRFGTGAVYERLGFSKIKYGQPSYFYMLKRDYMTRFHRSSFQKKSLIEHAGDEFKTEWQLAQDRGLDRIWDCGSATWIKTF